MLDETSCPPRRNRPSRVLVLAACSVLASGLAACAVAREEPFQFSWETLRPEWPPRTVEVALVVSLGVPAIEVELVGSRGATRKARLGLDTGCQVGLVLDESLDGELALPVRSEPFSLIGLPVEEGGEAGGVGRPRVTLRELPRLVLADGTSIHGVPTVHVPFPRRCIAAGIVGALGLHCLAGRAVLIDPRGGRMRALDDDAVARLVSGACVVVPADYRRTMPSVRATVYRDPTPFARPATPDVGEDVELAVDTGANDSAFALDSNVGSVTYGVQLGSIERLQTFAVVHRGTRLGFDFFLDVGRPVLFDPARSRLVFLPRPS